MQHAPATPGTLDYHPSHGWTATWTLGSPWPLGFDLDSPQAAVSRGICARRGVTVEGDTSATVYYDLDMATQAALSVAADDLLA